MKEENIGFVFFLSSIVLSAWTLHYAGFLYVNWVDLTTNWGWIGQYQQELYAIEFWLGVGWVLLLIITYYLGVKWRSINEGGDD